MALLMDIMLPVMGLLAFGSLNTISMKLAFTLSGVGLSGQTKTFQKPWFMTIVMFVGMSFALVCEAIAKLKSRRKGAMEPETFAANQVADDGFIKLEEEGGPSWSTKVVFTGIPASFDIVATGLCSMGFLYIPASVWQLLRGAEMVFAALFTIMFFRRRRLLGFQWLGILCSVIGITCVGLASVWGEADQPSPKSGGEKGNQLVLLGIALALGGQVVQAAQVIAEESLLKDMELPGNQIIGFEGLWGLLIMIAIVFPMLYLLPGNDNGSAENLQDSVTMAGSNSNLLNILILNTFSCATYNMAGMAVTDALSAVHRVMIEALRTTIVWIFGLGVHYLYDKNCKLGEAWTPWSFLEVIGFMWLILGQTIYGRMLIVPYLKYPESVTDVPSLHSPGALRNLASPLPAQPAQELFDDIFD